MVHAPATSTDGSASPHSSALVTGAASGIGKALATVLGRNGYRLHLFDINREMLDVTAPTLSAETATVGSVGDHRAMQALADQLGPVDLLCLNAGVVSSSTGAPWETSPEEWDRVLGVNLHGVVNGLRAFVPLMLHDDRPRQILITASLAGVTTWPGGGPYAASKHAVLAVAEQTALQLADSNISVTVLCPALVRTGMSPDGEDPLVWADEALRALEEQRFAVVPNEWSLAVEQRARTLMDGTQPATPSPNP
jgi:NAD(P)-dependent dehydrogenase (short-subunit alcohol dehydrogenase family)